MEIRLVRSLCSSVGETTCTGSGDLPSAAPFCVTGLKLGEIVNLRVNTSANEPGRPDLTRSGPETGASLHDERVIATHEEPDLHLVLYKRDVTDGMRSLWKVLVDVISKSCLEVITAVTSLENRAQPDTG